MTRIQAYQDVPISMEIGNARIELPDGVINMPNGIFDGTALNETRTDPGSGWLFTGLCSDNIELPDAETLRKGVFKADVTLLRAEGPNKADYYSMHVINHEPYLTAEWVRYLKSRGFNTIRIPVTWMNHTNDVTYAIDKEWLDKVEDTVNLVLEEDMYCVINIEFDGMVRFDQFTAGLTDEAKRAIHELGSGPLVLDTKPETDARFKAIWKQIAEHFIDYDEHLIFEVLLEPNTIEYEDPVVGKGWYTNLNFRDTPSGKPELGKKVAELVNKRNQLFVDTVRATAGNNAKRYLLSTPFFGKVMEATLRDFLIPADPSNHTLVTFLMGCGDDREVYNGEDVWKSVDKYLISKGIGVVCCEFLSWTTQSEAERAAFTREFAAQAKQRNIPLWVYAGEWYPIDNPENYPQNNCLYNPYTYEPAFPELISILMGNR